jgi:hypothetical protein
MEEGNQYKEKPNTTKPNKRLAGKQKEQNSNS